jgi:flavodoxin/ferredoxin
MNITLIYFSQTGNTRRVAQAMAAALREAGHPTRIISLKKATPQDAVNCDLLGIGTPCFSSQAPTPIKEFLEDLPPLDNHQAFVFATSGAAPGRVLFDLTRLLKQKGAEVIGGFLARGKLSHPAPCLYGRFPNRPDPHDFDRARRFAVAAVEHVTSGRPGPMPESESRPDTFKPQSRFYDLVASLSTDGFLRLVLPEPRFNPSRCDQCRWCVFECPVSNISMQPYPVLEDRCIRCYRCVSGCPQQAFDVDWRLGNLAILMFYNATFERWFGDLAPEEALYSANTNGK